MKFYWFLIFALISGSHLTQGNDDQGNKQLELEEALKSIFPYAIESDLHIALAEQLIQQFLPIILQTIEKSDRFARIAVGAGNAADWSRAPVIPELPDPIILPDGEYVLNITELGIFGDLALWNQTIVGLKGLEDSLEVKLPCTGDDPSGLNIIFKLFLPTIRLQGMHVINITLGPNAMTGNEEFHIGFGDTAVGLKVIMGFQPGTIGKLKVLGLLLDLSFGEWDFYAANFEIDEFPISAEDWKTLSENLRLNFNALWAGIQKPVSDAIAGIVNGIIQDCSIFDIILYILGIGNLSCLNIPPIPGMSPKPRPIDFDSPEKLAEQIVPAIIDMAEKTGTAKEMVRSLILSAPEYIEASELENILSGDINAPGQGRLSILPDFPDPLELNDTSTPFNLLGFVQGNLSLADASIVGLSTIDDDLTFRPIFLPVFSLIVNFTLAKGGKTVSALFAGTHSSEIDLLLPPISPIRLLTGDGDIRAEIVNATFDIGLRVGLQTGRPTHIQLSDMSATIEFDELSVIIENVFLGECLSIPLDWLSGVLNFLFDLIWGNNETGRKVILQFLTRTINDIIWDCNIPQLLHIFLNNGDTSCMSRPWQPTPAPTTTITTTRDPGTTITTSTTTTTTTTTPNPGADGGAEILKSMPFQLFGIYVIFLSYNYI